MFGLSPTDGAWLNRAFFALSDSKRREIIEVVLKNPGSTVNEICESFPVSRFVIMRQLNVLEDAQLLYRERDGNTKRLYVDQAQLKKLNDCWLDPMINIPVGTHNSRRDT